MTLCPDGDPIDVLVLSKFALTPGVVADCRIVGVMDMEDEKGGDAKLIDINKQVISDYMNKYKLNYFFNNKPCMKWRTPLALTPKNGSTSLATSMITPM